MVVDEIFNNENFAIYGNIKEGYAICLTHLVATSIARVSSSVRVGEKGGQGKASPLNIYLQLKIKLIILCLP